MKTILLFVALTLALGTSYAREAKKKPEPQVKAKPQPIVNRGPMKNCPHETIEERERRPLPEL